MRDRRRLCGRCRGCPVLAYSRTRALAVAALAAGIGPLVGYALP
ncbi:hypothetical protein AB0I49_18285 [Streptomyces sp. NPDC050617]